MEIRTTEEKAGKKICVIGGGRWGKNHIKTLAGLHCLAAVVETDPVRLGEILKQYPAVRGFTDLGEAIAERYDGYTVASPAETHYAVGKQLLQEGLNVMMEKPMTLTTEQSKALMALEKENGGRLMVGHVLLFHPAIRKIKEVIDSGKIGRLLYMYSNRLNLGTVRTEESVFASFAPHDVSVLDYLAGSHACKIDAKGAKFLQDKIYDSTLTQLEYPGNIHAHIYVSWLHPFKQQLLVVVGNKGMISFDDSSTEKEVLYYNKRIDFENGIPVKVDEPTCVIPYDMKMPLEEELKYFVEHLDAEIEINNSGDGYGVVEVLEKVQKQIEKQETPETKATKEFFIHESSYADDNVVIGKGTKIWHFSHIHKGARIGENCSLGQNVNIGNNVVVGNNVRIQNNVSVYEGVELKDNVFCGPSCVFTNVMTPRAHFPVHGVYQKTVIHEGASLGANCTIVCGHQVGKSALIAAGAVVTHDVGDYALMAGVPARRIGWVCECGSRLPESLVCHCGRAYHEEDETLTRLPAVHVDMEYTSSLR